MCGIVGILSKSPVAKRLLEGLKRLEYRGYDSAGIVTIHEDDFQRRRAAGKLRALENLCASRPIPGNIGIGHTRWATHGVANEDNAHPHMSEHVTLVHNGIIENFAELKNELQTRYTFKSQTDTEVIVYLLEDALKEGLSPLEALRKTISILKGAYSLAILFKDEPETLYGVRQKSPLVVGMNDEHGMMLGSDAISLAPWAQEICYLDDGDMAVLRMDSVTLYDRYHQKVHRPFIKNPINTDTIDKGPYPHYMLKEIFEQPQKLGDLIAKMIKVDAITTKESIHLEDCDVDFSTIDRMTIVACGASYYAGMVAKYWFEKLANIYVEVDIASEFRYRAPVFSKNHLCLFISQSGETIDTLAALELCKGKAKTLALVNVPQSSIARMADHVMFIQAGPEISVTSTKAFTCQLMRLLGLTLRAGHQKESIQKDKEQEIIQGLHMLPGVMHHVLENETIKTLAKEIIEAPHVVFIGRGTQYAIALEGALKLKEITYIPSQAYAAGELKHGPIALIDDKVPVFILAPFDHWFEKTMGNIQEVLARHGKVIAFTDTKGFDHLVNIFKHKFHEDHNVIAVPNIHQELQPFLMVSLLQLLAYHAAVHKGTDVDQPRNLAKSVTVE